MKKQLSLTIAALLLLTAGLLCLRLWRLLRPAAPETPAAMETAAENEYGVTFYRQDDPAWASDRLGGSKYTMRSSGCVVTSIASALSGGKSSVTPGELNVMFSENGVYDAKGNLQWYVLDGIEGFGVQVFGGVDREDIDGCLAHGRYPIIRVKIGGSGSVHYVLVIGVENGDYICMDPLKDEPVPLADYGGEIYAVRCVWKE